MAQSPEQNALKVLSLAMDELTDTRAENERLRALVQLGEKLFDQILPQAGKLVIDVGNLNNFLMEARKL